MLICSVIVRMAASSGSFGAVREIHQLVDEAHQFTDQQIFPASSDFIYCLLQTCTKRKDLAAVRQVHSLMVSSGLDSVSYLADHLIRFFVLCGSLSEAKQVFHKVARPSAYTWHAIISAHTELGESHKALDLYQNMQQEGIKPGKFIFLCVLKASSNVKAVGQGRLIHDQIIRTELESDLLIRNTLLDMHAKCGSLEEARHVFDRLQNRDIVSWGAMIAGYAMHGLGIQALKLFNKMEHLGIKPNTVIFLCVLKACGSIGMIEQGRLLHAEIIRNELLSDVMVGSALIDMYAKCGSLDEAHKVLDNLPNRDVVSWGAMLAGYAQHGKGPAALKLYEQMQREGVKPSKVTFLCILKACGSLGAIGKGRLIHDEVITDKLGSDVLIGNALVDMYAKCGSLEDAFRVFDELPSRDEVTWNSMISGCAEHGLSLPALERFSKMQEEGKKPDKVTLLCILKACCSIGAIKQGRQIHEEITRREFESDATVGSVLVDMYAKCDSMEEASTVFDAMQHRDVVSWGTIIAGYAQCGNHGCARQCLIDMECQGLKPDGWIYSSIMSACGHAGYVEEGHWYFKSMTQVHDLKPGMEHFNCMVDLLGRAGRLNEARSLLQTMPLQPDVTGWTSLLTCCRMYGNRELGRECFKEAILLDPDNAAGFVLMSNIYADTFMQEDVERIQGLQKYAGVWRKPGKAWIELNDTVHEFIMREPTPPDCSTKMFCKSASLKRQMKEKGYVPQLEVVLTLLLDEDGDHATSKPFVPHSMIFGDSLPLLDEGSVIQLLAY